MSDDNYSYSEEEYEYEYTDDEDGGVDDVSMDASQEDEDRANGIADTGKPSVKRGAQICTPAPSSGGKFDFEGW